MVATGLAVALGIAAGCSHKPVDYGGVAILEGTARRADRAESAILRGAAAVAIIETDVARGMGFVIDPAGYLLTNRHVIEDADHIEGVVFPARDPHRVFGSVRVVYIDPVHDLALLHVHSSEPLTAVPLATTTADPVAEYLEHADPVVLMERSVAEGEPAQLQVKHGAVSRLQVFNEAAGPGAFVGVTADVHQGQSGGPVLDRHGRAVGIVTWTFRERGGGFAIPISEATRMLADRPELGGEGERKERAEYRARLFLDAVQQSDGVAARRYTSPSEARSRREATVEQIMANVQEGSGLEAMQTFVLRLEEVVDLVKSAEDPELLSTGLDAVMRSVAEPAFATALGVDATVDIGQRLSFFHEVGRGYLNARVFAGARGGDALRAAFERLGTIRAARSFAIADLVKPLDGRVVEIDRVELLPAAYMPGARVELSVSDGPGDNERFDLHLRLEWGDYYVTTVEHVDV